MTGIMTATIETLTAEVRVLMVGSRQITLSVARQLDRADYHEIQPMGRIKIDKDQQHVIGKLGSDGTLVVCGMPISGLGRLRLLTDMFPSGEKVSLCYYDPYLGSNAGTYGFRVYGADLVENGLLDVCKGYSHDHDHDDKTHKAIPCRGASASPEFLDLWRKLQRTHDECNSETQERFRQANALPLIVLAGIK